MFSLPKVYNTMQVIVLSTSGVKVTSFSLPILTITYFVFILNFHDFIIFLRYAKHIDVLQPYRKPRVSCIQTLELFYFLFWGEGRKKIQKNWGGGQINYVFFLGGGFHILIFFFMD